MFKNIILILLLTRFSLPTQNLFDNALQEDPSSSTVLNYFALVTYLDILNVLGQLNVVEERFLERT